MSSAHERANYIKRNNIFYSIGDNCAVNFRKIPLYPKLISFGNNVISAANVTYVTHDVIHVMLNQNAGISKKYNEYIGAIEVCDNVFIGANTVIIPNVCIGSNTIIGAGSLVNKSIGNGVYGGVPVRYICSLEEFLVKREKFNDLELAFDENGLSRATIDACWSRFYDMKRDVSET